MCGIFGWSFKRRSRIPAAQREALASTLAIANSYRGDQSWGVAYIDREGRQRVRKQVGDIATVPGISALGAWDVLMAHTRYATKGSVVKDNQHPFRAGEVLLAHNGMIFNSEELDKAYGRSCAVDSMHFAHHLAEGRDFSDIEAYGSIEWLEGDSRSVRLCRMRQGQLAVYGIRNHKGKQVGTVWSSDAAHLRSAVGAARLDAFPYVKLEEGHVYEVTGGILHSTKRRLACVEPQWDPRVWSRYQSTQGVHTVYSFRRDDEDERTTDKRETDTSALVQAWLARKALEEKEAKERTSASLATYLAREGDTTIQVDEGLFATEDGEIVDLTASEDGQPEPQEEPCEVCGSLAGRNRFEECHDCGTFAGKRTPRLAEMTDEEWSAYERVRMN
jgi:hypothetical protein